MSMSHRQHWNAVDMQTDLRNALRLAILVEELGADTMGVSAHDALQAAERSEADLIQYLDRIGASCAERAKYLRVSA